MDPPPPAAAADAPFLLLLLLLASSVLVAQSSPAPTVSRISVVGVVYCDACSTTTFSKHSYLLPGVEVHVECSFRATSPKTSEQMSFSVNRTTDENGEYELEILPSVDGVKCLDGAAGSALAPLCQASLIGAGTSSSSSCNVPFIKSTATEVSSRHDNLCVYSLSALSYKPPLMNTTLCGQ